jgi:hypothetical protein
MATSFINATAKGVGATATVVFEAPAGVKAILIGCNLANVSNGILPVSLFVRKINGDEFFIIKNKRVGNGENEEVMKGNKLVIEAQDKLMAVTAVDSGFDVIASVLKGVS